MTSRASQRERILELLLAARGNWVSLPQVQACAAQYNARVFELRRLGYRITNRIREVQGQRHSWFRLESLPISVGTLDNVSTQSNLSAAIPDLSETASSFPEFGNIAPERYGD
jgi:hypothetical protein